MSELDSIRRSQPWEVVCCGVCGEDSSRRQVLTLRYSDGEEIHRCARCATEGGHEGAVQEFQGAA